MTRTAHVTLMASLPGLPRLERAEWLPINEARLLRRLDLLPARARHDLDLILDIVRWKEMPLGRDDAEQTARFRSAMASVLSDGLREHLGLRMEQRAMLAALRLRARDGDGAPGALPWGLNCGQQARAVLARWSQPDFGLSARFPWLLTARAHLAQGEALALERLMLGLADGQARAFYAQSTPFSTEQVCAYVLRWDVLRRWLTLSVGDGLPCFHNLLTEITDGHVLSA